MTPPAESPGSVSEASKVPAGSADTFNGLVSDGRTELREGYAEVGDVRLHYVEAGEGPLIVLLHGFPEFWYGWRLQIAAARGGGIPRRRARHARLQPVIEAGRRRGLRHRQAGRRHPRSHPRTRRRVRAAGRSRLGRNRRLGHRDEPPRGRGPAGHPQRGPSAEALAGTAPPRPAPEVLVLLLLRPPGAARSSVVHANHWHFFRHFLRDARPAYTPEEMDRYIEAWSQPGAATGMINYYRSSVRTSPKRAEAALRPITAPTLVIWGQDDRYLGPELAEPDHDDVPNLDRVERPTRRTGCITTRPSASTSCSSTFSGADRGDRDGRRRALTRLGLRPSLDSAGTEVRRCET